MNPRAMWTVTDGCARIGESSDTVAASVSNDQDTPADDTPFHAFVVTGTCRASVRNGLSDSCAVRLIDGSMKQCCYYSAEPSGLVISASLFTSP